MDRDLVATLAVDDDVCNYKLLCALFKLLHALQCMMSGNAYFNVAARLTNAAWEVVDTCASA